MVGNELTELTGSHPPSHKSKLYEHWCQTHAAAAAKSLQSCQTLCDPIDSSPPGSPVPGILQARTLEWAAIAFSNAWKWKVKVKLFSCVRVYTTPWTAVHKAPLALGFSRQKHWSGLPLPSPMHESEKWKWSHSVVSDSTWPHGLQPTMLLHLWGSPGKSTGVGCHCLLWLNIYLYLNCDHCKGNWKDYLAACIMDI